MINVNEEQRQLQIIQIHIHHFQIIGIHISHQVFFLSFLPLKIFCLIECFGAFLLVAFAQGPVNRRKEKWARFLFGLARDSPMKSTVQQGGYHRVIHWKDSDAKTRNHIVKIF